MLAFLFYVQDVRYAAIAGQLRDLGTPTVWRAAVVAPPALRVAGQKCRSK